MQSVIPDDIRRKLTPQQLAHLQQRCDLKEDYGYFELRHVYFPTDADMVVYQKEDRTLFLSGERFTDIVPRWHNAMYKYYMGYFKCRLFLYIGMPGQ